MIDALPLLLGPEGYQISRSVRTRSSASAYFNRTLTTPTNNKIFTISAWVKRGLLSTSANNQILAGYVPATSFDGFFIGGSASTYTDKLVYFDNTAGYLVSTQVFRDPSAWYHMIAAVDTTQATASNRVKLYVNGTQITSFSTTNYPSLNQAVIFNSAVAHTLGSFGYNSTAYYDGYLTEINFIDGQALTPSSFGETNAITGVWQPKKYAGTYGTNGFYLNFSDNSAATATTIGKDYSGNGNNWTPNNISVTAGSTYDSMTDVPTLTSATAANYAVWNPLSLQSSMSATDANLTSQNTGTVARTTIATIGVTSGKWYWELTAFGVTTLYAGVCSTQPAVGGYIGDASTGWAYANNGQKINAGSFTSYGSSWTTSDVIGVALDMDAGTVTFYKNNTSQGQAFSGITGTVFPAMSPNGVSGNGFNVNFGQRPFAYTPPTGYVALNTQNLSTPTISNGASYMAATTYTGTGANASISNAVNGVSMQPDLVWVKNRGSAVGHILVDAVRGANNVLRSNETTAEAGTGTYGNTITGFNSNGFSLGNDAVIPNGVNGSANTYVAWQWNGGGSTVTNTSGTISAQVRANPTAGFSVVTYTGTGSAATVGHGLGVAPSMIIVKNRNTASYGWFVWHTAFGAAGNTDYINLNLTDAKGSGGAVSMWNTTMPTSSVFSLGTYAGVNGNTNTYVAYLFAAVAGYSAFGSYTGNGSADGPFVYLGFRPKYVLIKSSVVSGGTWVVFDSARSTYNVTGEKLAPNTADSENSGATGIAGGVDFLSNGFKIRLSWGDINTSNTLIYAAFAENPFKNSLAR